jgi:hypothetical protein
VNFQENFPQEISFSVISTKFQTLKRSIKSLEFFLNSLFCFTDHENEISSRLKSCDLQIINEIRPKNFVEILNETRSRF